MSEKKLLEEGAVRRFMQLANIKPLNENEAAGGRGFGLTRGDNGRALAVEALEEEGQVEEGWSMEEAEEPSAAPEMGAELGGGEETGMEGGDIKSALEQIKAGLNALLGHLPEGGGEEFGLEDEPGEEDSGEEDSGEEEQEGQMYEELEEEGLYEELEEEGLTEELEEEGHVKQEGKLPAGLQKAIDKKKGAAPKHKKGEDKESMTEALAEELTRRVAARLMAEMKKGGAGLKQGAPFNKAAPKSKSAGHARNLTSGNTVAEGGNGAKKHAPKGHGVGIKQGAPFNKTAVPSKSAKGKRNPTTGNTVAGKKK